MTQTVPHGGAGTNNPGGESGDRLPAIRDLFTDDELRALTHLDDVAELLGPDATIVDAGELGSGFSLLDDKRQLCGKRCMFIAWQFNPGDFQRVNPATGEVEQGEFVSAYVAELNGRGDIVGRWIVNDGSAGIYQQLRAHSDKTGLYRALYVHRGLRASDYDYVDPNTGTRSPATTYYIDTTPVQ